MGEGDGGVVEAAEPRDLKIKLRSAQSTFSQFSKFCKTKMSLQDPDRPPGPGQGHRHQGWAETAAKEGKRERKRKGKGKGKGDGERLKIKKRDSISETKFNKNDIFYFVKKTLYNYCAKKKSPPQKRPYFSFFSPSVVGNEKAAENRCLSFHLADKEERNLPSDDAAVFTDLVLARLVVLLVRWVLLRPGRQDRGQRRRGRFRGTRQECRRGRCRRRGRGGGRSRQWCAGPIDWKEHKRVNILRARCKTFIGLLVDRLAAADGEEVPDYSDNIDQGGIEDLGEELDAPVEEQAEQQVEDRMERGTLAPSGTFKKAITKYY